MRLFKQRDIYYIEFDGGKRRSLRTKNKREADKIFNALQKESIQKQFREIDKTSSIRMSEFIDEYISHPDRLNLSSRTHESDRNAVMKFIKSIGDKEINLVSNNDFDLFKKDLLSKELSPFSINTYLRHLKAAFNFAIDQDYRKEPLKFKMLKTPEQKNHIIPPNKIDLLLKVSLDQNKEMWRIIKFTLYTACRRHEIINARYEHVSQEMISVCGKGQKTRNIPLISEAKSIFEESTKGKIFKYKHVSTVSNYFRKIARSIGLDYRFHDLRHTSATQMLRSGIPLEVVQQILGHSDIRTTQIYAKVLDDTMKNEMRKLEY